MLQTIQVFTLWVSGVEILCNRNIEENKGGNECEFPLGHYIRECLINIQIQLCILRNNIKINTYPHVSVAAKISTVMFMFLSLQQSDFLRKSSEMLLILKVCVQFCLFSQSNPTGSSLALSRHQLQPHPHALPSPVHVSCGSQAPCPPSFPPPTLHCTPASSTSRHSL